VKLAFRVSENKHRHVAEIAIQKFGSYLKQSSWRNGSKERKNSD